MSAAVQGVNRPAQVRVGERGPGHPPFVMKPPHLKHVAKKANKTDAPTQGNQSKIKEEPAKN